MWRVAARCTSTFRVLALGFLIGASLPVHAQIYKWVDEDGSIHYSSRPSARAKSEDVTQQVKSSGNFVEIETVETGVVSNSVTMLSTTWCGVCKKAKAWFNAKGIAFTELDVEKDEEGKRRYRELNGRAVPIILIGNQRMNGFSEDRMEQMLRSAGLI